MLQCTCMRPHARTEDASAVPTCMQELFLAKFGRLAIQNMNGQQKQIEYHNVGEQFVKYMLVFCFC
jgi:hypothetical protein